MVLDVIYDILKTSLIYTSRFLVLCHKITASNYVKYLRCLSLYKNALGT